MGALRRHLEDVASREPYMGEQIPVRWLRFECAVAELVDTGTDFVTLSQVRYGCRIYTSVSVENLVNAFYIFFRRRKMIYFDFKSDLTRFNKIAIQARAQMAADKEAVGLSRVQI